jgi:hypothetical protein
VTVATVERLGQRLVDGHKAMAGVDELGVLDAVRAVVPVWAVQALVANAIDELVAAVADGRVADVPTSIAKEVSQGGEGVLFLDSLELMARVMAVLVADVAVHAQIVIVARLAGDKFILWEDFDAAIAGAGWVFVLCNRLLLIGEGSRDFLLFLSVDLGPNALGGAVDNAAVLDKALDHPVAGSRAVNARINASRAEVVVAAIADAAVEVFVLHGMVAVVAVHDPGGLWAVRGKLRAECEIGVVGRICEVVEETWWQG